MLVPSAEAVALLMWALTSEGSCALRYSLSVGVGDAAGDGDRPDDAARRFGPDEHPAASETATMTAATRPNSDFTSITPQGFGCSTRRSTGGRSRCARSLAWPRQRALNPRSTGRHRERS